MIQEAVTNSHPNISIALSVLSFLGAGLSWAINLKVRGDILANNAEIERKINDVKKELATEIDRLKDETDRGYDELKDRITERCEKLDHDLRERIAAAVGTNKFVRGDVYREGISGINDRITRLQQFFENGLNKVEQGIVRQISDLKERIIGYRPPQK